MQRAKTVDAYIQNQPQWADALKSLRTLMLELGLEEGVKWGSPVYMLGGKNVLSLGGFKAFLSIWFYQGALLKDPENLLVAGTEGVTQAQRQLRFESEDALDLKLVKSFALEALENQRDGKSVKLKKDKPLVIPPELHEALEKDSTMQAAFDGFTPAKQREFAEYIFEAKRVETKQNRMEKILPKILAGEGLNDHYRR